MLLRFRGLASLLGLPSVLLVEGVLNGPGRETTHVCTNTCPLIQTDAAAHPLQPPLVLYTCRRVGICSAYAVLPICTAQSDEIKHEAISLTEIIITQLCELKNASGRCKNQPSSSRSEQRGTGGEVGYRKQALRGSLEASFSHDNST